MNVLKESNQESHCRRRRRFYPASGKRRSRNPALVDTRDQGDMKGQGRGADPPEAPAQ